MATFRKINLSIKKANYYGHFLISANYKGKLIEVITTDSECYDYLNDDSNKEKHQQAKKHAYNKIVTAYENLK